MHITLPALSGVILTYLLVFSRVGAMVMLLPAIGEMGKDKDTIVFQAVQNIIKKMREVVLIPVMVKVLMQVSQVEKIMIVIVLVTK